jgi:tetratricopeptide (TPR) repeat protein
MKKRICSWIGLAVCGLFCAGAAPVLASEDPAFAGANQAYSEGRFQDAIEGYQNLVRSGRWSANLFYDLGNAWFRAGDLGQAILNYQRALALDAHHPEAEANLRLARDEAHALELRKNWMDRYIDAGTATQ